LVTVRVKPAGDVLTSRETRMRSPSGYRRFAARSSGGPSVRGVPTAATRAPSRSRRAALTAAVALPLVALVALGPVSDDAHAVDEPIVLSADDAAVELSPLGTYRTGVIDAGASEIVAFHAATDQLFVVNADAGVVEVLDAADPTALTQVGELGATGTLAGDGSTVPDGAVANSVTVRADGLVAVALEAPTKTDDGWVAFFDATALTGGALGAVRVGALPDMVTFTPGGDRVVVANEGEPAEDFSIDPEGSIAVIDVPAEPAAATQGDVAIADFHAYEAEGALPEGVRVFGPTVDTDVPVSTNLEPEYVTTDSSTAWVTLQEANAIAVVDLDSATVTDIHPLGAKDHLLDGNGLDPSDRDAGIAIASWPVLGLPMPDTIDSYTSGGQTYLVTANEGDAREWGEYVEPARVKDLGDDGLAPICAGAPAAGLTGDEQLGRLNVTTADGLSEDGSCYEQLYAFGARSFSIWSTGGELLFDSGDALEQIVAQAVPEYFNSNHSESSLEGRSDDKGPEPEAVTVGEIDGRSYAFVGFERVGGIAVFDITSPEDVAFVTYVNNRDFSVSLEDADDPQAVLDQAGDLGPEGLVFISAADSPTGQPLLAAGNEVSGTTTLYAIGATGEPTPSPTDPATTTPPTTPEPTDPTDAPTQPEETGQPTTPPEQTAELAVVVDGPVVAGEEATARISGADPGEQLAATLHSEPVDVGVVTASADGTARLVFVVPATTEAGTHRLVITAASGSAEVTVEVLAAAGADGGGSLAETGVAGVGVLTALAALAVGAGASLLVVRRARHRG
jgi:hypothetical protein